MGASRPAPNGARPGRLYWREQGGARRAWADLRNVERNGRRIPLVPKGSTLATTDPAIAQVLFENAVREARERERQRTVLGIDPDADFLTAANAYLTERETAGDCTPEWLANQRRFLRRATRFFLVERHRKPGKPEPKPQPCNLQALDRSAVRAFVAWLATQDKGGRSVGKLSPQSIRHHVAALSCVFEWAIDAKHLPDGHNPARAKGVRPGVPATETEPLQPWDAALLLEGIRVAQAEGGIRWHCAYERAAFELLTGARTSEARRARVEDIRFETRTVRLRSASKGRRTVRARPRSVPMAPQLEEILRAHVRRLGRLAGPLFTASTESGEELSPAEDKARRRAAFAAGEVRAGLPEGSSGNRVLRTSYCHHRLSMDDADVQTVRLEMGHGSAAMIEAVYGVEQRRAERMGGELSFRLERWCHRIDPQRLAALATPVAGRLSKARAISAAMAAADVVRRFLAAVEGKSARQVQAETGVDDAITNKLRAGTQAGVKGRNLDRMRAYLEAFNQRGAA